ncbi:hypothetical protein TIFTF001_009799 [Ficus carica]|uniref:Uncharacterized protein n=1 Tax=Ficus carica TaxID=3494 RepID=A0AA87ZVB7_FICCA|nr:hypothetical protein TIFTF001_009799 [Ficus carica]
MVLSLTYPSLASQFFSVSGIFPAGGDELAVLAVARVRLSPPRGHDPCRCEIVILHRETSAFANSDLCVPRCNLRAPLLFND